MPSPTPNYGGGRYRAVLALCAGVAIIVPTRVWP